VFLSLEFPGGDKQLSLFARDLAHDKGFQAWMKPLDYDSQRSRVDRAVDRANRLLGDGRNRLINMIFNQFTWEGTTGWEYWTKEYDKVLLHALVVSHALDVPLHVHKSFDDHLFSAADIAGIKLEFTTPAYKINDLTRHNEQLQWKLDAAEYIQLVNVIMPKDTPVIELF